MHRRLQLAMIGLLCMMLMMTACSFGGNDAMEEMDMPPISYVDEDELFEIDENGEHQNEDEEEQQEVVEEEELVKRELYLLDANGLVAPQTIMLPKEEGVLRQSLEYLVDEGPITEVLPNGFQAVLPAGTIVDVNLKEDGLAIVDFSNEFNDYNPDHELQILQSVTWTLTQFDNVERVKIQINGYEQDAMPKNGTPINKELSRADGINIESDGVTDIVNSKGIALYFLAQNGDNTYFVPVTRRVVMKDKEKPMTALVDELLKGPSVHSPLLTDFRQGVALHEEPEIRDGKVTLNFNEAILSELQSTALSKEVLQMLVLTLTEQKEIDEVVIKVDGNADILTEEGKVVEPVSRPALVNDRVSL